MTITLDAKARTIKGKQTKRLRINGVIPAVLYGKDYNGTAIEIGQSDFSRVFHEAGETQIVTMKLGKDSIPVLVHDTARDPVTDVIIHVDFYQIDMNKLVEASIPVHIIGVSPAVKSGKGTLIVNLREIEIKALPNKLPPFIDVDVSSLVDVDHEITIKDLKMGSDVQVLHAPDQIVIVVAQLRSQESLESLSAEIKEDVQEVEGVKKEPKEGEEGEEGTKDAKSGEKAGGSDDKKQTDKSEKSDKSDKSG